jgi:hypothetical protein
VAAFTPKWQSRAKISRPGLTLPVMHNFHFFNRKDGNPGLICGVGLSGSWFPYKAIGETATLSNYDLMNGAAGLCLRINYFPFELEDKYLLGPYPDFMRSINHMYTVGILDFGVSLRLQ